MQDALLASIATFHTKKIILSDPLKFPHYGMIPETMYRGVTEKSNVLADYRKLPPIGPRVLSPEQQAALDALEKPTNRGKRVSKKEDPEERKSKSSKRKSGEGDTSQPKPKKIKKMARRPRGNTPPSTDNADEQSEEEEVRHVSPREPTPP